MPQLKQIFFRTVIVLGIHLGGRQLIKENKRRKKEIFFEVIRSGKTDRSNVLLFPFY